MRKTALLPVIFFLTLGFGLGWIVSDSLAGHSPLPEVEPVRGADSRRDLQGRIELLGQEIREGFSRLEQSLSHVSSQRQRPRDGAIAVSTLANRIEDLLVAIDSAVQRINEPVDPDVVARIRSANPTAKREAVLLLYQKLMSNPRAKHEAEQELLLATQQDILRLLGTPTHIFTSESADVTWNYTTDPQGAWGVNVTFRDGLVVRVQ